ncbi:MAG: hypothetical protein J6U20_14275 [Fibrobacter sp.]|nr:hypothetical protein [Fibrobacter sp.]
MKKIFSAMLLAALCATTQVSAASHSGEHSGFYFSQNLTLAYTSVDKTIDSKKSFGSEKETLLFSSPFFYGETRLGISLGNIASIYGILGAGYGSGSYSMEYKYSDLADSSDKEHVNNSFEDNTSSDTRYAFGIGGEFYPIRDDNSIFSGLFFGPSLGMMFDKITHLEKEDDEKTKTTTLINALIRLEVGKEWWISRNWCIGVAISYTLGDSESDVGEYEGHTNVETLSSDTFGLTFRIAH